jgi:hypothetical protein
MTVIKTKVALPRPTYVKYSEAKQGQTLVVGTFLGSKLVPNFNKDGEVPAHQFETDEGLTILNSASDLNKQLEQVTEGQVVEVVFLGTEKLKNKKGQPYKANKFEVSILKEG